MTDLGTFGGQSSCANGINDFGVAVGFADFPGDSIAHGFIYYPGGQIQDLNNLVDPSLGWTIEDGCAVNDSGQIAASAYQEYGVFHAVLLTPVPEPTTLCLLIVAVVVIVAVKARILSSRLRDYG